MGAIVELTLVGAKYTTCPFPEAVGKRITLSSISTWLLK